MEAYEFEVLTLGKDHVAMMAPHRLLSHELLSSEIAWSKDIAVARDVASECALLCAVSNDEDWLGRVPTALRPRLSEILELFGSMGETLLMAQVGLREVEAFFDAMERPPWNPSPAATYLPGYALSHRFLAESVGQLLLGGGHRLTNLAARICFLDPALASLARGDTRTYRRLLHALNNPGSNHRSAWLSYSDAPLVVALAKDTALEEAAFVPDRLQSHQSWRALDELRGTDFHRNRPVTPLDAKAATLSAGIDQLGCAVSDCTWLLAAASEALLDQFLLRLSGLTGGTVPVIRRQYKATSTSEPWWEMYADLEVEQETSPEPAQE